MPKAPHCAVRRSHRKMGPSSCIQRGESRLVIQSSPHMAPAALPFSDSSHNTCAGPAESLRILFGADQHATFQGFTSDDLNSALALLEHLTARGCLMQQWQAEWSPAAGDWRVASPVTESCPRPVSAGQPPCSSSFLCGWQSGDSAVPVWAWDTLPNAERRQGSFSTVPYVSKRLSMR